MQIGEERRGVMVKLFYLAALFCKVNDGPILLFNVTPLSCTD